MQDKSELQNFFEINRKRWNQITSQHLASEFYDQKGFLEGRNTLNPIERKGLGVLSGCQVLHLQCHFGQDSMSMARMGASVTGIDLSDESIRIARRYNEQLGLDCHFVRCNVYETRNHISDTFDWVFTSYGAICWLPDLKRWFDVIDASLKPGGYFYMVEFHPVLYMFEFPEKTLKYHYFNRMAYESISSESYTDGSNDEPGQEVFWNHAMTEVMHPFLEANYALCQFAEFDFSPYNCFENLKMRSPGEFVFDLPVSIPHIYELKFQKPA